MAKSILRCLFLTVKIGCFLRLLSLSNDFHFRSVYNKKDVIYTTISAFCSLIIIQAQPDFHDL